MRKRSRGLVAGTGLAALALLAAACGGGGSTSNGSSPSQGNVAGQSALNPGTGSPKSGGTLNVLGQGDVDYMDPNISYYSIGYLGARMWVRGLYANPAIPGKTTTIAPDIATAAPVVSNGGKTYKVTLRSGVMFDTTPASQVTAADVVLGMKRACNPVQPWGGLPDFETLVAGYQTFCTGFSKVKPNVAAIKQYVNSHQISGVSASGQTVTINLVHPASYFADILALPPFNPAPPQILDNLPASAASQRTGRTRWRATPQPGSSCSCATRPGRPARTRSARPTSTRS
jgi:peptide/nickel transport system substrate-binding protein